MNVPPRRPHGEGLPPPHCGGSGGQGNAWQSGVEARLSLLVPLSLVLTQLAGNPPPKNIARREPLSQVNVDNIALFHWSCCSLCSFGSEWIYPPPERPSPHRPVGGLPKKCRKQVCVRETALPLPNKDPVTNDPALSCPGSSLSRTRTGTWPGGWRPPASRPRG